MAIPDIVRSLLLLGLPVFAISWLLFDQLYTGGKIERNADHRTIRSSLKQIKKDARGREGRKRFDGDFLQRRWMKFGGGYYGLTALWTFVAIEASDLSQLILSFPGFNVLFADGFLQVVIRAFVNQIQNFVQAMVWFIWWPEKGASILPWILTSYASYLAGVNLARFTSPVSLVKRALSTRAKAVTAEPRDADD